MGAEPVPTDSHREGAMRIQEFAAALGATVDPEADLDVTGVATIQDAGPGEVTFLANPRYEARLATSHAGAVLVAPDFKGKARPMLLRVKNPYLAFARAIDFFYTSPTVPAGVHPTAVLGKDVVLGDDVAIGAYVVIGDRVHIGDGTVVHPHAVIYEGAHVGPACVLHSHTVVREHVRLGGGVILQNGVVVGADGFGFAPRGDGSYRKITQAGTVEIAEDVEIQGNACVDRAAVGMTRIGRGTKIDNFVQIGHGCDIGEDTLLCGHVGLAGSTSVGDRVTVAGQAGAAGHCRIGDDVVLAARTAVTKDIDKPGVYSGAPAMSMRLWRQCAVLYRKLPVLDKRLKALEEKVNAEKV